MQAMEEDDDNNSYPLMQITSPFGGDEMIGELSDDDDGQPPSPTPAAHTTHSRSASIESRSSGLTTLSSSSSDSASRPPSPRNSSRTKTTRKGEASKRGGDQSDGFTGPSSRSSSPFFEARKGRSAAKSDDQPCTSRKVLRNSSNSFSPLGSRSAFSASSRAHARKSHASSTRGPYTSENDDLEQPLRDRLRSASRGPSASRRSSRAPSMTPSVVTRASSRMSSRAPSPISSGRSSRAPSPAPGPSSSTTSARRPINIYKPLSQGGGLWEWVTDEHKASYQAYCRETDARRRLAKAKYGVSMRKLSNVQRKEVFTLARAAVAGKRRASSPGSAQPAKRCRQSAATAVAAAIFAAVPSASRASRRKSPTPAPRSRAASAAPAGGRAPSAIRMTRATSRGAQSRAGSVAPLSRASSVAPSVTGRAPRPAAARVRAPSAKPMSRAPSRAASRAGSPTTHAASSSTASRKKSARNRAPSRPRSASEERKHTMREEDIEWLKFAGLHVPGKQYRMKKKGEVDERSGRDFVKEIKAAEREEQADWDARTKRMNARKKPYSDDFVVGCTEYKGEWDEAEKEREVEVLIKYEHFPRGYWKKYRTRDHRVDWAHVRAVQEWRWRENVLSKVREEMKRECAAEGKDFAKEYPQVFLPKPDAVEKYALDAYCHRKTLLRAREATINACLSMMNLPPILIEDWIGDGKGDEAIFDFVWTNFVQFSSKIEHLRKKGKGDRLPHKCDKKCRCAGGMSAVCFCDPKGDTTVECGNECPCSEDCPTRIMQRGRQTPLLIIRHRVKGWTIRALEDLPRDFYVGDYAAEMLTQWENDRLPQVYTVECNYRFVDRRKAPKRGSKVLNGYEHQEFSLNGLRMANEGRFYAHHCQPNMRVRSRWIEREDWSLNRLGLWTEREVKIGQELTWNYQGKQAEQFAKDGKKFKSHLLSDCACGSGALCMIAKWTRWDWREFEQTKRLLAKRQERERRRMENEEDISGSEDSCSESEDDEPVIAQKKKNTRRRRELAESSGSSRGRSYSPEL